MTDPRAIVWGTADVTFGPAVVTDASRLVVFDDSDTSTLPVLVEWDGPENADGWLAIDTDNGF